MRRPARHLFTLCSAASLLLCLAVCVLWVRSYFSEDSVIAADRTPDSRLRIRQLSNRMGVLAHDESSYDTRYFVVTRSAEVEMESTARLTLFGISLCSNEPAPDRVLVAAAPDSVAGLRWVRYDEDPLRMHGRMVWVPHWLLLLLFGLTPAARAVAAARRSLRRANGLCPRCGYDLRATPGRCPECGAEAAEWRSGGGAPGEVL
jgi:hypothetical protein